ncbi:hypothetical protein WG66_005339 [Moniliophthora roreri]|nr:hypothetical protein WG66_005339 [Moniliophthora roreri]
MPGSLAGQPQSWLLRIWVIFSKERHLHDWFAKTLPKYRLGHPHPIVVVVNLAVAISVVVISTSSRVTNIPVIPAIITVVAVVTIVIR